MIGYCLVCGDDVPVSEARRCEADGSLAIPPSWSDTGAAVPWPPRPADYVPLYLRVLAQPAKPAKPQRIAQRVTAVRPRHGTCAVCGAAFAKEARGGLAQRYCSQVCKQRADNARRREQRHLLAARPAARACLRCGAVFEPPRPAGKPQVYCSPACRRRARDARRARPPASRRRKGVAA